MDKYTKTINALKKEYKELQKTKNKNIKGGSKEPLGDIFDKNLYYHYQNNIDNINDTLVMNCMLFNYTN